MAGPKMASPTGIHTKAFIWLRGFQLLFAVGTFATGCIEQLRWALVFGMLFPMMGLTFLLLLDSTLFYKRRYATGAGKVSTLRWVMDLFMNVLLGALIPLSLVTLPQYYYDRYPDEVPVGYALVMLGLACISLSLFFATFVMLCVEDARLRKRGRTLLPTATEAMPSHDGRMYREAPEAWALGSLVGAERARTLVNNILANGFTVEHLEKMGSAPGPMPARNPFAKVAAHSTEKIEFQPGPPHYNA